ncbi:hypothetical protein TNCV_1386361 [Trichonephila clavipes]|nr:hypothetical protein TNCV_1386361 [Trichonephila clavipes]
MSSPGFEPRPYGTAVSVASHYTGYATKNRMPQGRNFFLCRFLRCNNKYEYPGYYQNYRLQHHRSDKTIWFDFNFLLRSISRFRSSQLWVEAEKKTSIGCTKPKRFQP